MWNYWFWLSRHNPSFQITPTSTRFLSDTHTWHKGGAPTSLSRKKCLSPRFKYFPSQYPYPADSCPIQHPVFQRPYSLGSDGKLNRFRSYSPLQQYPRHPARNRFAELCAESTATPSFSSVSRPAGEVGLWSLEDGERVCPFQGAVAPVA